MSKNNFSVLTIYMGSISCSTCLWYFFIGEMSDTCQIHSSNNDFSTQKASDKVEKHENNLAMKKPRDQNQSQYKSI